MKFMKGVILGTMISAGAFIMYKESNIGKNKMMKQGKKIMKNMGIM